MRKQDMKVGETYRIVKKEYGYPAGTEVVYKEDDGTKCVVFTFPNGLDLYLYCSDVEPAAITFDQMMEAFKKHLPNNTTHVTLVEGFRAYRNGDTYLAIGLGKSVDLNLFYSKRELIESEPETQYLCNIALEKLKAYEAEQAPVEMTIGEIASKLGVDVDKLRIKE